MRWTSLLLLAATALPALGGERVLADSLRPLLIAAIDSPQGSAHGTLTGDYAEALKRKFATRAPVEIDVTTEYRFAQPGCSRLKVLMSQAGVVMSAGAAPEDKKIEFGLNYCRDGAAPRAQTPGAAAPVPGGAER